MVLLSSHSPDEWTYPEPVFWFPVPGAGSVFIMKLFLLRNGFFLKRLRRLAAFEATMFLISMKTRQIRCAEDDQTFMEMILAGLSLTQRCLKVSCCEMVTAGENLLKPYGSDGM